MDLKPQPDTAHQKPEDNPLRHNHLGSNLSRDLGPSRNLGRRAQHLHKKDLDTHQHEEELIEEILIQGQIGGRQRADLNGDRIAEPIHVELAKLKVQIQVKPQKVAAARVAVHGVHARHDYLNRLLKTESRAIAVRSLQAMMQRLDADRQRLTRQEMTLLTLARLYAGRTFSAGDANELAVPSQNRLALSVERLDVEELLKSSPTLLAEMIKVQQSCTVSPKNLVAGVPTKGIHFAHTLQELIDVLSPPGAVLEVGSDESGRIWSMAIYHTDGEQFAIEDDELVDRAFAFVDSNGRALIQPVDKLAVGHCVCVDPDVALPLEQGGSGQLAASVYGMHDEAFEQGLEQAGSTVVVATCRSDNPAIESHLARNWQYWDEAQPQQMHKRFESEAGSVDLTFNLIKRTPAWLRGR